MTTENTYTIAPLTTNDLEAAADGHPVDVDELRKAVAALNAEFEETGDELADDQIPDRHGDYTEGSVIARDDEHVTIYVDWGTLAEWVDHGLDLNIDDETVRAVGWAHNNYARRRGASEQVLGNMDAATIPRTEFVDRTIEERE